MLLDFVIVACTVLTESQYGGSVVYSHESDGYSKLHVPGQWVYACILCNCKAMMHCIGKARQRATFGILGGGMAPLPPPSLNPPMLGTQGQGAIRGWLSDADAAITETRSTNEAVDKHRAALRRGQLSTT